MTSMLFILFFIVTSFSLFDFTLKLNTLNRTIINTPKSIFEISIPLDKCDENNIYFDKNVIYSKLMSYYRRNIDRYISSYKLQLYYYNQDNYSICIGDFCDALEVTFECNISEFYRYHRVMYYEIHRKVING